MLDENLKLLITAHAATSRRFSTAGPRGRETPGLADLDSFIVAARSAGVEVEATWRGERRTLPRDIDLSAYRIIQESVTNVVRHATVDACRVSIDYQPHELVIEVANDGPGGAAAPSTGYGLVGLRERVTLLRGDFSAGHRDGGGYLVTAHLPLAGTA